MLKSFKKNWRVLLLILVTNMSSVDVLASAMAKETRAEKEVHMERAAPKIRVTSERIIWDKQPIPVTLAIGQERLIHFPSDVRYWIPETLKDAINVLSANGVLYVHAYQPFSKTRIRVQDIDTQRVYLLDIVSQVAGDYPPNLLVTPKTDIVSLSHTQSKQNKPVDWPIRLMRFAAQSLYAPERLSPADRAIRRIAVNTDPINLLRGGEVEAKPLAQWQGGGLAITAVLIRNLTRQSIIIASDKTALAKPTDNSIYLSHDIRGRWLTAAAQHSLLKPAGDDADRTCLYLVSRQPFAGSF